MEESSRELRPPNIAWWHVHLVLHTLTCHYRGNFGTKVEGWCLHQLTASIRKWIIQLLIWTPSQTAWFKTAVTPLLKLWRCYSLLLNDEVIKWKHFPRYWPFVRGIHQSTVNSSHKGQWRGALMFSLICARINSWVYNDKADDLRRHCAHYASL